MLTYELDAPPTRQQQVLLNQLAYGLAGLARLTRAIVANQPFYVGNGVVGLVTPGPGTWLVFCEFADSTDSTLATSEGLDPEKLLAGIRHFRR